MAKAVNISEVIKSESNKRNAASAKSKDRVVDFVYYTKNLNKFKVLEGNRDIKYDKKMFEQAKQGYLIPILVNENYEVIDGQHRLYHAKLADVGIKYIVNEGLTKNDVIRVNINQRKWGINDFIESFAREGIEDYVKLRQIIQLSIMPTSSIIAIALGKYTESSNLNDIVKKGDFRFKDYSEFLKFIDFYSKFTELLKIDRNNRKYRQCIALYTVFSQTNVDMDRLIKKINQSRNVDDFIQKNLSRTESMQLIIDANNNRLKESNPNYIKYYITQENRLVIAGTE
ncbi:hypothetical protein [Staphylococcus sp. LKG3-3]|uniref:hypothetical protein n=1 Tax=Staphylococcus sp. LKG3-3 TaxID=3399685 RepID=UPI003D3AC809